MIAAVVTQLAFAVIWMTVGGLLTWIVSTVRRDRAQAATEDARVEAEFGGTLARWRPAMDLAGCLRPVGAAVRKGRARWAARFAVAARAATGRLRAAVAPRVEPPEPRHTVRRRDDIADLDVNNVVWPVNPAPAPALPVGRVAVELDFDPMAEDFGAWLRGKTAELNHHIAQRASDPDTTGYIPRIPAEQVSR